MTIRISNKLLSEITLPPMWNLNGTLFWSLREVQRLYNTYGKVSKDKLLLLFPDRTWDAIKSKAQRLKIMKKNRRYSRDEDEVLLELADMGVKYRDMPQYFRGRTKAGLAMRLSHLRKHA